MKLFEFVRVFEQVIEKLRSSTSKVGATMEDTSIVPSTKITSLELHACEVYTRNIFFYH